MRLGYQFLTAFVVGFMALSIYEGVRLWRADLRTADILAAHADRPIRLAQLSDSRRDMLLAVEDPSFHRHSGVDLSTAGQGMTTITQALTKRLYFEEFKPGFAKIEQSLIARYVLDPALTKDEQLELMLNYAYFGHVHGKPVTGFGEAAAIYYNTPFESLADEQFLALVAMLVAPNALDPVDHAAENEERVQRIRRMLARECAPAGWLDVWYENCAGNTAVASADPA